MAAQARSAGKKVWAYNGSRPQTDAFFTDTEAVAPRANAWIASMAGIERWFYWETTFWFDDDNGGQGAYDPFATGETFHNSDGDWCEGDGVLLYPGTQASPFASSSAGFNGVFASIRLKNLRRGVQDAGYLALARAADPAKADAIAKTLLPKILTDASGGSPVSWSQAGKPWFDARKALVELIPKEAAPPPSGSDGGAGGTLPDGGTAPGGGDAGSGGPNGGSAEGPSAQDSAGSASGCSASGGSRAARAGEAGALASLAMLGLVSLATTRRARCKRRQAQRP
jgi:hypothetical protein